MLDASHNPNGLRMFFKSIQNEYPLEKYEYRVIYGCKKGRNTNNYINCLKEIDGKAKYLHFISMDKKTSKSILELKEYQVQNDYTEIVEDKSNDNGDVELEVLNAINLCYRNKKSEITGVAR